MLTNEQHLYNKLADESVEIAQLALKIQILGADNVKPGQTLTNKEMLHIELNHLLAAIDMLNDECGFNFKRDEQLIKDKIDMVQTYRNYSRGLGLTEINKAKPAPVEILHPMLKHGKHISKQS